VLDVLSKMRYKATEKDIERAYAKLDEDSQGREATNPEYLARYLFDDDFIRHENPNVALIEFHDTKEIRWKSVCDRIMTYELLEPRSRLRGESLVSNSHFEGRLLRFLEVYSWERTEHYIFEELTELNPFISYEKSFTK